MNSYLVIAAVVVVFVGTSEGLLGGLVNRCTKCQWNSNGTRFANLLSSSTNYTSMSSVNCDWNSAEKKAKAGSTLCILGQACAEFKATVNNTQFRFMGCIRSDACSSDGQFKSYTALDGTKGELRCHATANMVSALLVFLLAIFSIHYHY